MKKYLFAALAVLALAIPGVAQQLTPSPGDPGHVQGSIYFAPAYAVWKAQILSGNSSTGAGATIIVNAPAGLPDGYVIPISSVFPTAAPFVPIAIIDGSPETIVPTAVAIAACPNGTAGPINGQCATITANIANTHGASATITSGDSGIMEAITDAGAQGGGVVFWQTDTGVVTLSTGGATTTTTTKVPTQIYGIGATARITTTVTTATTWSVGSTTGGVAIFCSSNSTMTAGTTCIANQVAPAVTGTTNALTTLTFSFTGTPGAGAIKARVWGFTPVQSTI